jgi:uncharacterized protein YeaO (DUF488 family)
MVQTKSVETTIEPAKDGLRVLAARFRGRGLPASRYDVWMPNLGPSESLLRSFLNGQVTWAEFGRAYRAELFLDGDLDKKNKTIKNHGQKFTLRLLQELAKREPVTLLCHCAENEEHCHRHLLQRLLQGKI